MTRVLAVADADSYLKWSAATLDRLPGEWSRRQVLVTTPITPSPAQAEAATGGPVECLGRRRLRRTLRDDRPDVVLLACTGPTVRALLGLPELRGAGRPVLVSGLPGISVPASARAVDLRRGCDLFVVHSRRERISFARLAADRAPGLEVALSRLPFLTGHRLPATRTGGSDVVFAAQAKVPPERAQRTAILLALAATEPVGSALVKVRAVAGEQQTHHEQHPYAELWDELVAAGQAAPDAVRFRAGPMSQALAGARSLVTVSSTAALEAMDVGVPVLILSDFGVDAAMINEVFADSGCLGTLADLRAGVAYAPQRQWAADNYFHPDADDDLLARLDALVTRRSSTGLRTPDLAAAGAAGAGRLRLRLRLLVPARLLRWARTLRSGCPKKVGPGS